MKRSIPFLLTAGFIYSCAHSPKPIAPKIVIPENPPFEFVLEKLKSDASLALAKNFPIDQVHYVEEAVGYRLLDRAHKERDFSGYTNKRSIRKVRQFLKDHPKALNIAQKETGVPPPIIAAILYLETTYSNNEGKYKAADTLFSLASLIHPGWAAREIERVKKISAENPDRYTYADQIQWETRTKTIGEKSFEELRAYFMLCEKYKIHILKMKSSWAGAMGKGQFIPSTALQLMSAGDYSKQSLFHWSDTIRLTAAHLQRDGWTATADENTKFEAVRKYNGMTEYAKAVFQISDLVTKTPTKK